MGLGRDPERTPMQWDSSPNAGFSKTSPWLPLADDYEQVNVAAQREDPKSMLTLTRQLIALRRAEPALSVGSYRQLPAEGNLFAYVRADPESGERFAVVLNLGAEPDELPMEGEHGVLKGGTIRISTHLDRVEDKVRGSLALRPNEGVVVELASR
jgi:alpha-glucosidase